MSPVCQPLYYDPLICPPFTDLSILPFLVSFLSVTWIHVHYYTLPSRVLQTSFVSSYFTILTLDFRLHSLSYTILSQHPILCSKKILWNSCVPFIPFVHVYSCVLAEIIDNDNVERSVKGGQNRGQCREVSEGRA